MNGIRTSLLGMSVVCLVAACGAPASDEDVNGWADSEATPEALQSHLSEEDSLGLLSAKGHASKCAPQVDESIAVPSGNRLAFELDAVGSQIYVCQASGAGYAWTLQAPEALLYNHRGKEVGSHYAGPTWEYKDGSLVVGTKLAAFTPDTTAIPWLLLEATGHSGEGKMEDVTYVQRLDTEGGLAPDAATCTADTVGAVVPVEYVASYYYFVPGKPPCGCK